MEWNKGASIKDAAKTAIISGLTSAVSVGLASTGAGILASGAAASAANAALQKILYGDVNITAALSSALPPSAGSVFLGRVGIQGATLGTVSGFISGPSAVFGNTFFSSYNESPCLWIIR